MAFVIDRCYSADEVHGGWATPVWMAPVRLRASLVRFRLGGTLGPWGLRLPSGPVARSRHRPDVVRMSALAAPSLPEVRCSRGRQRLRWCGRDGDFLQALPTSRLVVDRDRLARK
jgi:hypothetical protein